MQHSCITLMWPADFYCIVSYTDELLFKQPILCNRFGLKIEVKMNMKLPGKYGERLHTKNFRRVTSDAAISIDYDPKLKIIEIEYKNGKIYHYLEMNKKVWNKFLELADKGKGLGAYINQDFKRMLDENDDDYYQLFHVRKWQSK